MKHPLSSFMREIAESGSEFGMASALTTAASELDRQHRDLHILAECILSTRNPGMNRVYAECDVQEILGRPKT